MATRGMRVFDSAGYRDISVLARLWDKLGTGTELAR